MSKQEVTPWFPASVTPVRRGIYEYQYGPGSHDKRIQRFHWDGVMWRPIGKLAEWTAETAHVYRDQWRGLINPGA